LTAKYLHFPSCNSFQPGNKLIVENLSIKYWANIQNCILKAEMIVVRLFMIIFYFKYFYIKNNIMEYNKYIIRNPAIMLGKPTIKGTRITVELIMRKLAGGFTLEDLISSYPHLNKKQIYAAFEYAADLIANEEVFEIA
jgi:uncharacterized protein (DUF433 family)